MNKSQIKICQNCKTDFIIESEDFAFYEKMQVPIPSICGYCRIKRIMMFRNETTLYKRNCDLCGESMVSMYNPNSLYTVYCNDCYYSDRWNAKDYAKDYDKNRPFMEQMKELLLIVPKKTFCIVGDKGIRGEYQNFASFNKKCYFVFNSGYTESCSYSRGLRYCRDVLDSYFAEQLEKSYECVNVQNSYGICYSQNAVNCLNSQFLFNCNNLQNCFGCVNLRNKNYHFLNKPLGEKEYIDRVSGILGSYDGIEKFWREFRDFKSDFPHRQNNNIKTIDSDGEYILQSKNCHHCFELISGENCKFNFFTKSIKDSYDNVGYGYDCELNLATVAVGRSSKVIGSFSSHYCINIEYCFDVEKADYCIGCDGLRNAKYSILNKEYDKNEYEILRDQIIGQLKKGGQYGLYFPPEMAPFAYNETVALNIFPASKEEAMKQGFRWEDNIPHTYNKETLKPERIPDNIKDVPDDILNEILKCISCGANYRLIKSELEFYREMLIPIPRKCFNCRHSDRINRRGPFKLRLRHCSLCNQEIKTTYLPEESKIVYCERCYQQEIV